jgi:hypothetical protein
MSALQMQGLFPYPEHLLSHQQGPDLSSPACPAPLLLPTRAWPQMVRAAVGSLRTVIENPSLLYAPFILLSPMYPHNYSLVVPEITLVALGRRGAENIGSSDARVLFCVDNVPCVIGVFSPMYIVSMHSNRVNHPQNLRNTPSFSLDHVWPPATEACLDRLLPCYLLAICYPILQDAALPPSSRPGTCTPERSAGILPTIARSDSLLNLSITAQLTL